MIFNRFMNIKNYSVLFGLFNCFLLLGQENAKSQLFVSNSFNNDGTIVLKWIAEQVYFDGGCKVYRKESNNWNLLTPDGINIKKIAPINLDNKSKELHKIAIETNYEKFQNDLSKMFVLMEGVLNPNFADVLGIQYFDKTAEIGKTYKYKVVGISAGNEITIGKETEIIVNKYEKEKPPSDINIIREKKIIYFVWKPELLRYYAINIYRKSDNEEEYKKINEYPFALQKIKKQNGSIEFPKYYYSDKKVNDAELYSYKLTTIDYFGQESDFSEEIAVPAQDFIFPEAPFNLKPKAFASEQKVELSWDKIEEADLKGFNIYRKDKFEDELVKINLELIQKDSNTYIDKVANSGKYYYLVSSVDFAGNESKSGLVFIEVRDMLAPSPPQGLISSTKPGTITLSWDANTEADLKGYFIQRSLNDSNNIDNHYININSKSIIETSFTQKIR